MRDSRSVNLTLAGEAMRERAHQTLRNIDDARIIGRGEVGSLHVGFIGSRMPTTVALELLVFEA